MSYLLTIFFLSLSFAMPVQAESIFEKDGGTNFSFPDFSFFSAEQEEVAQRFMQAIIQNDLATLKDVVNPEDYEKIVSAVMLKAGLQMFLNSMNDSRKNQIEYENLTINTKEKSEDKATVAIAGKIKSTLIDVPITFSPFNLSMSLQHFSDGWRVITIK